MSIFKKRQSLNKTWHKASTFGSMEDVAECINLALNALKPEVRQFLATTKPRLLILDGEASRTIGQVASPGHSTHKTSKFRFVLVRDDDPDYGFRPTTYFPRRADARAGLHALTTPLEHLFGGYFNEDAAQDYDNWQTALAQMSIDAPSLYADLPGAIERTLQSSDDAALERLFTELDFGMAIIGGPRDFLTQVGTQIQMLAAVNASLNAPDER